MPPIAKHFRFTHAELSQIAEKDPALAGQIAAGLEVERITDERQRCENSLIEFLIAAWPHMGEAGELAINWHHEVIARNLEAVARGERRNLVINQPPRTTKTLMVSVCYPAFLWAQPEENWGPLMGPHVRFLCVSYGATLAEEIAVKMRRLVQGNWYQRHWGHQVEIRDDQQSRSNFGNTRGGERISTSIEGGILGRGGAIQLIDDPHHVKGAESDTQRTETLEGMRSLVTRVTDPRIAARVMVMQRLHVDDATNYALEHWDRVRHLMLPMRFDPRRADPEDPRKEEGELLWPEVMTPKFVREEERELTNYGCSPAAAPVLMADLTLRAISEVCVGDEVVGFTTQNSLSAPKEYGRHSRRKLVKSTVLRVLRYPSAPIVCLTLQSGAAVRCTPDHQWYRINGGPSDPVYQQAGIGRKIARICETDLPRLEGDDLRLAGWLGGFYDGEGSVSMSHKRGVGEGFRHSAQIVFYQGSGRNAPLCVKLEATLTHFGFEWTVREDDRKDNKTAACYGYRAYKLKGHNLSLYQRFLHIVQPNKWRERLIAGAFGARFVREWDTILTIQPDGQEDVFALETTTGNYVVSGYASSNSAGQLQQEPTSRGGNIIQREWWRLWPEDYPEAGLMDPIYYCRMCGWSKQMRGEDAVPELDCPSCGSTASRNVPFPEFSFRMVAVDTAYGEKQENSWSAMTAWGIWHDKEDAPRVMLTDAWRGRPRLRGVPDSPDKQLRRGLVEQTYEFATRNRADLVLIEQKTRGTDLYQELEVLAQEWPFSLVYDSPVQSKEIRLEACVPLFTNERVWAPEKRWADTVINEVAAAPTGKFNDLTDTVSASLRYMRANNLLSLGEEFRREERRKLVFRGKKERGGTSIRERYET